MDASSTCSARSSERARAVSTIAAATGMTPEVEIELRRVVDDEVRRLAEVVVAVADDHRVRAEQRAQRHPARGLGDDDEHRAADEVA